jgi:thiol peroxidase
MVAPDQSGKTLADYAGRVKILSVVPSPDTSVCHAQAKTFDLAAETLGDDVVIFAISADLPFAQKRGAEDVGVECTQFLSTHRDMKFSDDY